MKWLVSVYQTFCYYYYYYYLSEPDLCNMHLKYHTSFSVIIPHTDHTHVHICMFCIFFQEYFNIILILAHSYTNLYTVYMYVLYVENVDIKSIIQKLFQIL